jgi:hypothetical protein
MRSVFIFTSGVVIVDFKPGRKASNPQLYVYPMYMLYKHIYLMSYTEVTYKLIESAYYLDTSMFTINYST